MTNPDKLQLVNYSHKTCNTENFKTQNFGRENFDDSTSICKFVRLFHCQSFTYYSILTAFHSFIHFPAIHSLVLALMISNS